MSFDIMSYFAFGSVCYTNSMHQCRSRTGRRKLPSVEALLYFHVCLRSKAGQVEQLRSGKIQFDDGGSEAAAMMAAEVAPESCLGASGPRCWHPCLSSSRAACRKPSRRSLRTRRCTQMRWHRHVMPYAQHRCLCQTELAHSRPPRAPKGSSWSSPVLQDADHC